MIKQFILVVFILFLSSSAFASTQAPSVRTSQGETFIICNNETTDGVCDNGTEDFVAFVSGYNNLTFFFTEKSPASASTCQAYAIGHYSEDGNAINVLGTPDLSVLSTVGLFSTVLSSTQRAITLTNPDFNAVFVSCTSNAVSMNVVVEMRGSTKAPLR